MFYLQLALLLHGTDEPVDRTEIASKHHPDHGQRVGQQDYRWWHTHWRTLNQIRYQCVELNSTPGVKTEACMWIVLTVGKSVRLRISIKFQNNRKKFVVKIIHLKILSIKDNVKRVTDRARKTFWLHCVVTLEEWVICLVSCWCCWSWMTSVRIGRGMVSPFTYPDEKWK